MVAARMLGLRRIRGRRHRRRRDRQALLRASLLLRASPGGLSALSGLPNRREPLVLPLESVLGELIMKSGSHTLAAFVLAFGLIPVSIARADDAPKAEAPPIPTLHCVVKKLTACAPDGKCIADDKIEGVKLPMNITVDFENSIVAAVDSDNFARTDRMDDVVKTTDQLVLHGVDGEFGWQMMISDKTEVASLVMSTADSVLSGFGTCTNK
jgi:hypothetical protein